VQLGSSAVPSFPIAKEPSAYNRDHGRIKAELEDSCEILGKIHAYSVDC